MNHKMLELLLDEVFKWNFPRMNRPHALLIMVWFPSVIIEDPL